MDFRVSHSLELLASLKRVVADFAKREEEHLRDLRFRRHAVTKKCNETVSRTVAWHDEQHAAAQAAAAAERERVGGIHDSRHGRVLRARTTLTRDLIRGGQEAKGRWLGNLQLRKLNAERAMDAGIAAADAEASKFAARLSEKGRALLALEAGARNAMSGYSRFCALLRAKPQQHTPRGCIEEYEELKARLHEADEKLGEFRGFPLPRIFAAVPLPAMILPLAMAGVAGAFAMGFTPQSFVVMGVALLALLVVLVLMHRAGAAQSAATAASLAAALVAGRRAHDASAAAATADHAEEKKRCEAEYARVCAEVETEWGRADEIAAAYEKKARVKVEKQLPLVAERNNTMLEVRVARLETTRAARIAELDTDAATRKQRATEARDTELAQIAREETARWTELEAAWRAAIDPLYRELDELNAAGNEAFPPWSAQLVEQWRPRDQFAAAVRFARLETELKTLAGAVPVQLALPGDARVSIPLSLAFPAQGALLFETKDAAAGDIAATFNNVIVRLLAAMPPGKVAFTIIDPVGLGQNFAGLMHLSDYEEAVINRRIWTQRDQIEERLAELNEHIEKVIQMYLRNEFATISEYNAQAGSVAEKYHFLVVADFPGAFSETTAKRLQSIATSGPRCGVFTLIHRDERLQPPDGFAPEDVRKNAVCLRREGAGFALREPHAGATLVLDAPPDAEIEAAFVHRVGKASIDSNRVEVPFSHVAPPPEEMWTSETTNELRVAVGRTGATKLQYLAIGKGTRQHALFAGKTGSGKSTLFHVIITNLALACSPEQVEFYLIDFKKGVEFKCYATKRLPHARVVAIESDREFGLSVLQRVDDELKRRGDLFRKLGVQDVAGYKKAGGAEPMPRSLLLIDEFQEFFTEDDEVAQNASVLFDRIVRQGRAFGIHVLLGSQTLGGAYTLARATLGQMVIRVALQCNEADAYLIMDDTNSAPRLLSRPGEGIYNDAAGAVEGNSPFQVVWLPDDERDQWLDRVHELALKNGGQHAAPIVFEGNAPAEIRENALLDRTLATAPAAAPSLARCWLGAPNSIKGPTEVVFQRQSGSHLLVVGQRDEAALAILGVSLVALAAQHPAGTARFVFIHAATPGTPDAEFIERIVAGIPHGVTVARANEVAAAMAGVATELKARSSGESSADAPSVFVFVHGLQRFKKLRQEDDFSFSPSGDEGAATGAQFAELINEGSTHGLHLLATVDNYNSVGRFIGRKALTEIEWRVVFQMSANDSASLIDSPKASTLGLHRALLHNEHAGSMETFRPYAMPDAAWIEEALKKLRRE